MKKVILIMMTISFLVFVSTNVNAETFSETFTVETVMPSGLGLHFKVSPNPAQCIGDWWGNQFIITNDTPNYNVLSAAILSAYATGKKIKAIHWSPAGDGTCSYGNWLSVSAFLVKD